MSQEFNIDWTRQHRCGFPEVIYGESKSADQIIAIVSEMSARGVDVFATRISAEKAAALAERFPDGAYNPVGRTFRLVPDGVQKDLSGKVAIVTAGTSDLPVAEEAKETVLWFGCEADLINDVGVAGPARLMEKLPRIQSADAVIVIAGMVVLDLILSGMNVILGLLLIIGAGLFAYLMDSMNHEPRRTTSITRAARQTRELQEAAPKAELSIAV